MANSWLDRPHITSGQATDFSDWSVLKWWQTHGDSYLEISDLARRQLCAQASSVKSESAFSKAGLIISKKRRRLTIDHVYSISFMGWDYKDSGWENPQRDPTDGRRKF